MQWRVIAPGEPWDGIEVEAADWQAARCAAEEAIRVEVVSGLQFQLVSAQDILDERLAPLAAAAVCVELIAQLQEVQIITRHDRSRTRVAVGTRVWYGDTLLAALRAAAEQAEGD